MPITDVFKRVLPKYGTGPEDQDKPANIQAAFENFSSSLGAFIRVGSTAEADTVAAAAPAGTKWPLFFWDTSAGRPLVKDSADAPTVDAIGAGVPENTVYVAGQWYELSGRQTLSSFSWTQDSNNWWATTLNIPWPYTPPAGYSFVYQADQTNGHTIFQAVNHGFNNGFTACRVLNYAHQAPSVKTVIWQLVKIS